MTAQTILPANSASSGSYQVANSLRFDKPSDSYLEKTFSSAGSTRKFTFSTWLKGHDTAVHGSTYFFVGNINGSTNIDAIGITNTGIQISINSANSGSLNSTALFKDMSAWYHFVIGVDTTQGTASNRVKVYINGVQVTAWDTETYPDENYDFTGINSTEVHNVSYANSEHNGYLAETVFIDGTQLDQTSFGEFDSDSGIWKPIDVSGLTFGQNGFYLEYKGVSTGQNSNGLGADTSGNGHHFASSGLAAIDQSTDTCTNNFATLNPLFPAGGTLTFSEGNTSISAPNDGNWKTTLATMAAQNGKWYMEFKSGGNYAMVGVCDFNITNRGIDGDNFGTKTTISAFGYGYYNGDGTVRYEGGTELSYGNTYGNNDIVGIALDCDNDKLYFSKNGTFQNSGDPTSGATGTNAVSLNTTAGRLWGFAFSIYQTNDRFANFGSPAFAISSGNADANGHGNFEYAVPSGYFALNTKNLAEHG